MSHLHILIAGLFLSKKYPFSQESTHFPFYKNLFSEQEVQVENKLHIPSLV